ncbi:hypothetical protein DVR12_20015 [Chitinophaga silvatica]|uniref:Uncharacterized protein n=1 Tax=Chitinophaga silvatica TaxID=2282649 RepID=A0A3E1Y5K1_9BACT|nr:hypothetical protein [Chitinophaga silvatica]RFS20013.1 hypothetical protein DVR12_20015 [Chitinophaga silvatica]
MKKYIAIFCVYLLWSCTTSKKTKCTDLSDIQPKSYAEVYSSIDSLVNHKFVKGYLEFPWKLKENHGFRTILGNPCTYKSGLIAILKNDSLDVTHRLFALHGLERLCIDDYIEVLTIVYDLYKSKKVNEAFMISAIATEDFSMDVAKNYKNIHLQEILKDVLHILESENQKKFVNSVLSGKRWKYLKAYYRDSGEPRPWTCD